MRCRRFSAHFETTMYYESMNTAEVWGCGISEIISENETVEIFNNINNFMDYVFFQSNSEKAKVIVYLHELKFYGYFVLSYLFKNDYKLAYVVENEETGAGNWIEKKSMPAKSFSTLISQYGAWYMISIISEDGRLVEIRDSKKLIPLDLDELANGFATKHKPPKNVPRGIHHEHDPLTVIEADCIRNAVLCLSECLNEMFLLGLTGITISSCALQEFKRTIGYRTYDKLFPDLTEHETPYLSIDSSDPHDFGATNADEYIRCAYHGGWCYVAPWKTRKLIKKGLTLDVNGLYYYVMSSRSGNSYPVGEPVFFVGAPDDDMLQGNYWFIRIRTRFYLKPHKFPFIQLKDAFEYGYNEILSDSDLHIDGESYSHDENGEPIRVTLTLSKTDFGLFYKNYDLVDTEILDGVVFRRKIGVFDRYIEKYTLMKENNNNNKARRTIAKFMLVSLYGKLATGIDASYKVPCFVDGKVKFYTVKSTKKEQNQKTTMGNIAAGAAITSYARAYTVQAAQSNYRDFCYSDTDSLHLSTQNVSEIKGVKIHESELGAWKIENRWSRGYFVRQKTYIEQLEKRRILPCQKYQLADGLPALTEKERLNLSAFRQYNVVCAGMPQNCKRLFMETISRHTLSKSEKMKLSDEELDWTSEKHKMTDFDFGLSVPGKLVPSIVDGGVVLVPENYTLI